MKKLVLSILGLVFLVANTFAQIEVGTNNNVGVGFGGDVNSKLSVNTIGSVNWTGFFYNDSPINGQGALVGKKEQPGAGSSGLGVFGICFSGNGYAYGVKGYAYNTTAYSSGRSYGVYGIAGNATDGYNYGVYGIISGSNSGAGVYGTTSGDSKISGVYAGYFYGDTKVTGELWIGSLHYTSDKKAKKDIKDLEKENIAKLKQVKAVKYKYKTPKELGFIESDTTSSPMSEEMIEYYNTERIGLLAQEVAVVYPELVSTDQQGMMGVDYVGLIPVLIEALKEQQVAIEALNEEVVKLKKKNN